MGFESALGSRTEADLAEDHQIPEGLFREIICRWDAGASEEGEEKFLFGSCEEGLEGLGGFETERLFADVVQFGDGAFFDLGRFLPGDVAGFKLFSYVAKPGAEIDEAVAEGADPRILFRLR